MKYLILVKHSLPGIMEEITARDWVLSDEGRSRSELLMKRLEPYQPEVIISSVEPKAIQTAEIIAHFLNLQVDVVENLHEHDRSNTAFLSRDMFESLVQEFFARPDVLVFGRETANQAYRRFDQAVRFILNKYKNQTLIIVTHGTVISLFVSRLTGIPDFSLWNELGLPSFFVLDMQSNTVVAQENIP